MRVCALHTRKELKYIYIVWLEEKEKKEAQVVIKREHINAAGACVHIAHIQRERDEYISTRRSNEPINNIVFNVTTTRAPLMLFKMMMMIVIGTRVAGELLLLS